MERETNTSTNDVEPTLSCGTEDADRRWQHQRTTASTRRSACTDVWRYCKVSIAQMRGIHDCELCPGEYVESGEHKGENLLLGTSSSASSPTMVTSMRPRR